ncbi:transglutaminase domain-containing protein [Sedimentibacter hydroxybenzoicus DSM 7310]|uniref:Transglutaminase domain-containing protein n=1 Tax=Sedimentibacter hydroxybenzoicus DSM 7310 TaxID=1123245 RepID=A0A974GVM9_SEDHY|nr:transglutaminase-like domain-containing protein [Sedimentibacter hydroxybenzoicus]NYB73240.1 transglutaminase domain-containing protein [Sedimentibacter hydroxybenzoicus DSM 7310]
MLLKDLKYLKVNLPEDVLKMKMNGNFTDAIKLINLRLNKQIPVAMRKRLELEKEIINTIKNEYTYTFDEALKKCQDNIKDFTKEELIFLQEDSQADWILIDGQVKFNDSFYGSLLVTRADLNERLIEQKESRNERAEYLDANIKDMKENKEASYYIHLKTSLKIKGECARTGEKIKVHMPLPANCQQKNIKIIKTTPAAKFISDEDHPSRTAYFETVLQENMEFSVEYSYESHLKYNEPDTEKVSVQQPAFDTNEFEPQIMFTPYIKELANEIIGDETNPLIKARKIYDYITQNIKYSYMRTYSTIINIPEYCALNLKGDCGVQALLFITLCRYTGIPAKWQSGLAVTPYHVGPHDWAQFYVEPYGWLFADPSFGGGGYRNGNTDKWDFYFANLDPFRMVANSELQHEFDPPKQYFRHDPYDNQVGECEYEDRAIRREEFRVNFELIEMKKIS